ncbi:MAG: hypothetical protein ABIJ34_05490 [archaeon]
MEFLSEKLGYLTGFVSAYLIFTSIMFFIISVKISANFFTIVIGTSITAVIGFILKRIIS